MPTRRRFISIVACCSAVAPLPAALSAPAAEPTVWRGSALGAPASMTLVHPDRELARARIDACVREVERLEAIFSLYRADSAVSRLNAAGRLDAPPQELLELLSFALALAQRSGGAFDPTVQPLYRLYAEHFARPDAASGGPPAAAVEQARRRVGFAAVDLRPHRIRLRPGMALTLNGVAQGFVTDRVARLLREAGFDDVLIDLGEARALGHRAGGAPWRAAIADPRQPGATLLELPLGDAPGAWPALATSAGSGTRFGSDPRLHHLLDPHTGRSANHHLAVSVAAGQATLADGLSTALSVLEPQRAQALLASYPSTRAFVLDAGGRLATLGAAG